MRHGRWAVPLALFTLFAAAEARAQQYPRSVYQARYYNTYRNYYGQPEAAPGSPSDAPPMPGAVDPPPAPDAAPLDAAPEPVADDAPAGDGYIHESCDPPCTGGGYAGSACGCLTACGLVPAACGCNSGCNSGCDDGCDGDGDDEVWRLFGDVTLIPGAKKQCCCDPDPLSFFIGGWMQGGITGNASGNRSATGNFPVPYNFISDGAIGNQFPWIYAERIADTGGAGFAWGARVDYLFGTDSKFTNAFGDHTWDYKWQSSRDYGSAIPQLYGDLAYNNVSLRLGHFYTIIGYEVVPAIGNFFYSHALTQNFGEPFTHTGGLAKYRPDDNWTFYGGLTNGWDSGFENPNDSYTFLGGAAFAMEDLGSLAWGVNTGKWGNGTAFAPSPFTPAAPGVPATQGSPGANNGDIYMNSLVGSLNLTGDVQWVIEHDHGVNFNVPGGPGAEWYSIVNYLFITLTDTMKFGARVEWFDDADGARIGAVNPVTSGAPPGLRAEGDYFEYTLGLNVIPHPNFRVRPELRWDRFNGFAPPGGLPYNNGTDDDLFTAGVDGILQF